MDEALKVYVYGHYDSRGGTTAISAKSRETADQVYNEELFTWSDMLTETSVAECLKHGWDPRNPANSPASQDFLYEARLAGPVPGDDNVELDDYGELGEVWMSQACFESYAHDARYPDQVMELVFVPCERFEGPLQRVARGWGPPEHLGLGESRPHEVEVDETGSGTLYVTEAASMIRAWLQDGRVLEFDTNQEQRTADWMHPSWGDDAYGFVLMYR